MPVFSPVGVRSWRGYYYGNPFFFFRGGCGASHGVWVTRNGHGVRRAQLISLMSRGGGSSGSVGGGPGLNPDRFAIPRSSIFFSLIGTGHQ